ncbi:MAG: hypothetical protein ABI615_07005 [Chthoniobacterales bacterium]
MKPVPAKKLFSSPYFWVVISTPLLPLNLFFAAGFWVATKVRNGTALQAKSCLNVQLTYMLVFVFPILAATKLSHFLDASPVHWSMTETVMAALPLGLMSLAGILGLAFFNLRIFAENVHDEHLSPIPRIRFLPE